MRGRTTIILLCVLIGLIGYFYFFEIKGAAKRARSEERINRILGWEDTDLKKIVFKRPENTIIFDRNMDGWWLQAPIRTEADGAELDGLISDLKNARIERRIDATDNPADFGLNPARFTVIITSVNDETDTLLFGDRNPTDRYVFVKANRYPEVILTGTSIESQLSKSVFEFRDKSVLKFENDSVWNIRLAYIDKSEISIERDGKAWQIVSPVETSADPYAVNMLLTKLADAKAKSFESEASNNLKTFGLVNPSAAITLTIGDDQRTKRLLIGNEKETNRFYAKDESRGPIFTVDSVLVKELKKDLFDLRDKNITHFERDSVRVIQVMHGDTSTIVFRMDEAEDWRIISPVESKAKKWKVVGLLSGIEYLKAKKFVGRPTSDLERYGLERPRIEVSFKSNADHLLVHLHIGKRSADADGVYIRNILSGWVFLTEDSIIDDLMIDLKDMSEAETEAEDKEDNS